MPHIKRDKGVQADPIPVIVKGSLARKIRDHYAISQQGSHYGGRISLETYILEIVDAFMADRRSGKVRINYEVPLYASTLDGAQDESEGGRDLT
jgi:hypothetical protein